MEEKVKQEIHCGGFPIMVYKSEHILTNKEYEVLISREYSYYMRKDVPTSGSITTEHYVLDNPELAKIKKDIENHLHNYTWALMKINNPFIITNSWCTRNPKGTTHHKHTHPNSIFSGVYYADAESSDITFSWPTTFSKNFNFQYDYWAHNEYNSEQYVLSPRSGDIVIFPSWIDHSVSENTGDNDRIVIGFNSFVTGELGTTDINTYVNLDTKNAEH